MKRFLLSLVLMAFASAALAQPFVWPNAWTTAEPGEATPGGTLQTFAVGEVSSFNPVTSAEATSVTDLLWRLHGAFLVTQGPDSDDYIPYAAESFEISEDGLTVDLTLRDGIMWSDGTPVTVQDYLLTYELERDEEVEASGFDSWFIDEEPILMEAVGDNGIRVTFPTVDRTALPVLVMLPTPDHILGEIYRESGAEGIKGAWGTDVDFSETAWTSPWIPTSFRDGERLTLERNPTFGEWNVDEQGNPLPYMDGVSLAIVQDIDAALNLYIAGELDIYNPASLDQIGVINQAIQNGDIDATILESVSAVDSSQFIVFNHNLSSNSFKQDLFRAAEFRQAMSHLVDREAMAELVYGGAASPMYSNVYQVLDTWVNDDVAKFDYDPEEALALLNGLGFNDLDGNGVLEDAEGNELSFNLITNAGNDQREQLMQIFADSARDIGVDVQPQAIEFGLMVEQLLTTGEDRPFDAILIGLTGGNRDWPFGSNVLPCGGNLHMYNTSGECIYPQETLIERLYNEGRQTLDDDAAREIGNQIQAEQAQFQPIIYTVSPDQHYSWSNAIAGEHPEEIISSILGSRQLELTFKR